MNRFLLGCLLVITSVSFGQKKPNVLFIAIDDMKPLIHDYGYDQAITPNFDRLMDEGVSFEKAYCQYPVCGPTRASLMTGLRPEVNGVMNLKTKMRDVNPNALTLAQHFKNNGYETVARGKIFDPRCVESKTEDDKESWSIPYSTPHGKHLHPDGHLATMAIGDNDEEHTDGQTAKEGIEFINKLSNKEKPFFVAIGFKKPHLPFIAPTKYFDMYDKSKFKLESFQTVPKGADAKYILNKNNELLSYNPTPLDGGKILPYAPYKLGKSLTEVQQRELIHGYFACVSYIDNLLGNILDALENTGQADNTIIVLWGDHGFHLGDHGMWGKHTTMEQAARVPLIFKAPGIKSAKTSSLAEFLDIFPTLCDLAGLETPKHLQGKSLVPVLKCEKKSVRETAITQYKRAGAYGYSMRTEKYRYTEWVTADGTVRYKDLYDLDNDPNETVNILGNDPELDIKLAVLLRANKEGLKRLK
ncbi:hypothetical protein AXE80_07595 [Wenyingzhuangia fucanilytica]|uniref:Sulfatase N-terminal domain-containing protein n=1 Tax=Wenyingzhuangia fucanilytica TaxID=1790137 RepID=A0A1B1Y5X5_9FLAO|nr:sulfatase [Wenyingzhuangia fucanilytica]ANW96149.1 hypothetical protein AXE80_07595 [Wenyingzhuangia fucanilytica]